MMRRKLRHKQTQMHDFKPLWSFMIIGGIFISSTLFSDHLAVFNILTVFFFFLNSFYFTSALFWGNCISVLGKMNLITQYFLKILLKEKCLIWLALFECKEFSCLRTASVSWQTNVEGCGYRLGATPTSRDVLLRIPNSAVTTTGQFTCINETPQVFHSSTLGFSWVPHLPQPFTIVCLFMLSHQLYRPTAAHGIFF